jgi:hypothetical protein
MIFYKFRLKSGGLVDTGVNGFWSPTLTAKDPEIPYLPLEDAAAGGSFISAWARNTNSTVGNMKKNVAGQKVGAQLVSATDGSAFAGAVTVYVTGDAGTQAIGSVGGGACTHEGNGYHTYAPAQAETNYDLTAFTFIGTGAVAATVQAYNSFPQTTDNPANLPNSGALSNLDAAISTRMATYTQPTGFLAATFPGTVASTTNITAGTITTATNVTTVNGLAAGVITATSIASDAITDAKVASDVTIASVTGSVGAVTGLTASDVGAIKTKTDFLPSATAGAAGGLFIAGSNAATTYASMTVTGVTIFTGNIALADGLTIASPSTADRSGLTISGNGTGHGISATGGATGTGATFLGGATSGNGFTVQAQTAGDGFRAIGTGSVRHGISATGGSTGASHGILGQGSDTGSGVRGLATGTGSGVFISGGATSGNGLTISTTDGHAISATATGSNKHGMVLTGGTGGTSDGLKAVAGTGGVPIRGSITGDLSGSVGSVTGLTNATIADQVWDEVLSGHLTAGSTGNALNAAGAAGDPWTTSLPGAYGAGSAGYIIGNNVDALISSRLAPTTAGRTLDVSATGEAGIDWANIGSPSTSVNLSATNIDVDQVVASVSGAVGSVSGLTSAAISDAVWDEVLSGHLTGGSTGNALNAAGAAGDPWSTALPGAYSAGTAGRIIGDNINATISSRATQTSVDTIDGIVDSILVDTAEIGTAGAGLTALSAQTATAVWEEIAPAIPVDDSYGLLMTQAAERALNAYNSAQSANSGVSDIQTRLPAALTAGGNMKSDVLALNGDTTSAANIAKTTRAIARITASGTPTTTNIPTSSIAPAVTVADQLKGRILTFDADTTTAALRGQATDITANTSGGVLTVTALTTAPVSGDFGSVT